MTKEAKGRSKFCKMVKNGKDVKNSDQNLGITLIALVVTIVVLLILAGVTINAILGDNGIIAQARRAADAAKEAAKNDEENINELANELNSILNGGGTGDGEKDPQDQPDPPPPPPTLKQPQIKDSMGKVLDADNNKTVYDEYNNPVEIPAGFAIVPNGKNNVEYKYTDTTDHIPSVQDGIVITDEIREDGTSTGNEFVWIPVSTEERKINNKDKSTTEIKLGRYTFDSAGTPSTPKTNGEAIESYYTEDPKNNDGKSSYGNAIAKDIEAFKTSATTNGGYYLARYEAGKDNSGGTDKVVSKPGVVWNNIKQTEASAKAQAMYAGKEKDYISDLTNSYAWDTAIVFIQKYSGDDDYSRQIAKNYQSDKNAPDNTGERPNDGENGTTDKVCNIYDMASNCYEWTTETSSGSDLPCVRRGGGYNGSNRCTAIRVYYSDYAYTSVSFRPTLYVK